ncbi:MAG: replication factor C large subunit [Candidatus Heimdallarchaeota archaeon]|nr:replication factor C large subunit [Candidatus Heimdallarchaeota archaeon]
MQPWVEKYRPQKRSDLIGNESSVNGVYLFLKKWNSRTSKIRGVLLIGPPGCGKTSAALALANELNYEIVEVNASDTRNKNSLKSTFGKAAKTFNPYASRQRLLLVEEIDGLAGNSDRGGLNEVIKIIKSSYYPIISTANDEESDKVMKLSKELRVFHFNRLDELDMFELLERIAEKEKLSIPEEDIEAIVENSQGDMRAAINELESYYQIKLNTNVQRNKMMTLTEMINSLYRSKSVGEAKDILSNAPSNYRFILHSIFDTFDSQCKNPNELYLSTLQLAEADLVLARIMRTQNWSLLKYFFEFLSSGLVLSRPSHMYHKLDHIPDYPNFARKMGIANRKRVKLVPISIKASNKLHIAPSRFLKEDLDIFVKIINGKNGNEIAAWLDLTDDEVQTLVKLGGNSKLPSQMNLARMKMTKFRYNKGKLQENQNFILDPYLSLKERDKEIEINVSETSTNSNDVEIADTHEDQIQTSLDDFF